MNPIICLFIQVPVRSKASHRSEMVSQLLFGEKAAVLEEKGEWLKIRTFFDDYTGWVERHAVTDPGKQSARDSIVLKEPLTPTGIDHQLSYLPAGAEIPVPDENGNFSLAGHLFQLKAELNEENGSLTQTALKFLHAPYLWGGRTVFGIDCSGFIQLIFKVHGVKLPRDAAEQAAAGKEVGSTDEVMENDLVFFSNKEGKINHVGMYLGSGQVIHASKQVRIDHLDQKGLYNESLGQYTHSFHSIRRIL